MQAVSQQQLINDFDTYMGQSGIRNPGWYVGIASDPEQRLFSDHNVSKQFGTWIYSRGFNSAEVRELEQLYFAAGCKGGPGGGDHTTVYLYAYVITPTHQTTYTKGVSTHE